MKIKTDDIFEFAKLRIACHVRALNYFAEMFNMQFPEHDGDKNIEPSRTGHAYIIYAMYHKNFHIPDEYEQLCLDAKQHHREHASHHMLHYKNTADIPDTRIYEMVCDWASANFERRKILRAENALSLNDWFKQNKSELDWTPHQLDLIKKALKIINENIDETKVKSFWEPLLELTDL